MRKSTIYATAALFPFLLTACDSAASTSGADEGWKPDGNAQFVVPADAGGGQDLMARSMAEGFEAADGDLTISVENMPGGSSAVGYEYVQQMEEDAETLITGTVSVLTLPLTTDVSYTWDSFTPIAMIGEDQGIAVVRDDSEFDDLGDLVEASASDHIRAAVSGRDGPSDLILRMLAGETGGDFGAVTFQSGAEGITALLAGDVEVAFMTPNEAAGQLEAGDMRALAVFGEEGFPEDSLLGDVPTAVEQGVDVTLGQFRGVFAPGGITEEQRDYWASLTEEYTQTDEYDEYVERGLMVGRFLEAEEFEEYLTEQEANLAEVVDN